MKSFIITLLLLTWSSLGMAQYDDLPMQAEAAFSDSEEAKAEAIELRRHAEKEKKRQANLKIEARRSLEEAKRAEAEAVKAANQARREADASALQIKEYERQMKVTEARKAEAQKKIQIAKNAISKTQAERNKVQARKIASDKELQILDNEAASHVRFVKEANMDLRNAHSEALMARQRVIASQEHVRKSREEAKHKVDLARAREAAYRAETQKFNSQQAQ